MKKNIYREPIQYIIGNEERAEEIRHIIEDEWGGINLKNHLYTTSSTVYFISAYGEVSSCSITYGDFKKAVANGWMKEYKLQEKTKFKPFDKVVVKAAKGCTWKAAFYSHKGSVNHIMTNSYEYQYCLPYNEDTAKLIGTKDEWKGGSND